MLRSTIDEKIPHDFLCPITHEIMQDPAVAHDGHSYEREAIERWFALGKHTSPKTGKLLKSLALLPNCTLKSIITSWQEGQLIIKNKAKRKERKAELVSLLAGELLGCKQQVKQEKRRKEKEKEYEPERREAITYSRFFSSIKNEESMPHPQWGDESLALPYPILSILPDGHLLLLERNLSKTIHVYDVKRGQITRSMKLACTLDIFDVASVRVIALDEQHIVIGNAQEISIVDLSKGRVERLLTLSTGGVLVLLPLPDNRLAAGDGGGKVSIWHVNTGECEHVLEHGKDSQSAIWSLALLDEHRLASGSNDGSICIWNIQKGIEEKKLEISPQRFPPENELSLYLLWQIGGTVSSLLVLPNGLLMAGYGDKKVRIWDVDKAFYVGCLAPHADWPREFILLPNGKLISVASNHLYFWQEWWKEEHEVITVPHAIQQVKLLPDGSLMIIGAERSLWQLPALTLEDKALKEIAKPSFFGK